MRKTIITVPKMAGKMPPSVLASRGSSARSPTAGSCRRGAAEPGEVVGRVGPVDVERTSSFSWASTVRKTTRVEAADSICFASFTSSSA